MLLGEALQVGRTWALAASKSNQPNGSRFNKEMGRWLDQCGFDDLDKSERSHLLKTMNNRDAIEKWRATLTTSALLKLNHPRRVFEKWQASTQPPKPKKASKAVTQSERIAELEGEVTGLREQVKERDEEAVDRDWKTNSGDPVEVIEALAALAYKGPQVESDKLDLVNLRFLIGWLRTLEARAKKGQPKAKKTVTAKPKAALAKRKAEAKRTGERAAAP